MPPLFKKVQLATAFVFVIGSSRALGGPPPVEETYFYSIKYLHLPVARAILRVQDGGELGGHPVRHITVEARTNSLLSFLFRVNNRYESFVDLKKGCSLRFLKDIRQSNLTQNLVIVYDQDEHIARFSDGRSCSILENTHDFFSGLFYLGRQTLKVGDEILLNLDVEGIPWMARTRVLRKERVRSPIGDIKAIVAQTTFRTNRPGASKPRRTDVLTNRLVGEGTDLLTWFSDDEKRVLLKAKYRRSPFSIVVDLVGVTRISTRVTHQPF